MFASPNNARQTFFEISNMVSSKFNCYYFGVFNLVCSASDTATFTNISFSDYYIDQSFVWGARMCNSAVFKNFLFENAIGNQYQAISVIGTQNIEIYNVTMRNITGSEFPLSSLITTNTSPSTSLIIDRVTIEDCRFLSTKFYATLAPLDYFEFVNINFSNVSITSGESLVVLDDIKHLLFTNMTFDNVINSDTTNEGSTIILLNSLNLNSDITTEVYEVGFNSIENIGNHSETNFFAIPEDQLTD